MFLNVRDFYNARKADFPSETTGGELFAALLTIIEQIEALSAATLSITGGVARMIDVKGDAKALFVNLLKDISGISGAMTFEFNGLEHRFRTPRNRSVPNLIAAGRAFASDAVEFKDDFVRYGLKADFISELAAATDTLEAAYSDLNDRIQERIGKNAAFAPLLRDGMEMVTRLQPIVKMKYRTDAENLSAWIYASHVEREPNPEKPQPTV